MLKNLFASRGRAKILETFVLNEENEFYTRELARWTGLTPRYVKRELYNLKNLGLLIEKTEGNMTYYVVNKSSPIVKDLRGLFLRIENLGKELFEELKSDREKIKYALILGSFANSADIHLMVVGDIGEDRILQSVIKAQNRIGQDKINYILWTEKDFSEKTEERIELLKSISRIPVIMIIGEIGKFKRSIEELGSVKS